MTYLDRQFDAVEGTGGGLNKETEIGICTSKVSRRAFMTLLVPSAGTIALGLESVEAAGVTTRTTPTTEPTKDGYPEEYPRKVDHDSVQNIKILVQGKASQTPQNISPPEGVGPIKDAKGMSIILNNGSLLEEKSAKELGLPDTLDASTMKETMRILFDGNDLRTWLRNTDGSELTANKQAIARGNLAKELVEYTKRIEGLKNEPNGDKIMSTFLALYNGGKGTITFSSRASLHRLFINSLSIAYTIHASPEEQAKLAPIFMTQMGEYILLTDKTARVSKYQIARVSKYQIDMLKYLAPSRYSVWRNPHFQAFPNIKDRYYVTTETLKGIRESNEKIDNSGKKK